MTGVILTTTPTPNDVRKRLQVICAAYAVAHPTLLKTVLFDSAADLTTAGSPTSGQLAANCPLTASDLPALVAIYTSGSVASTDTGGTRQRHVTRDYHLLVLWYEVEGAEIEYQIPALTKQMTLIDELPDYFATLQKTGLKNVEMIGHMSDAGSENPRLWLGRTFSATDYILPVTTTRR